jgi:hypothetical protein
MITGGLLPNPPPSKKIKTMLNIIFMASWHGAWTDITYQLYVLALSIANLQVLRKKTL